MGLAVDRSFDAISSGIGVVNAPTDVAAAKTIEESRREMKYELRRPLNFRCDASRD